LIKTADGGFVLSGTIVQETSLGNLENLWVIKTDADGNPKWSQTYGVQGSRFHEFATSVVQTSDFAFLMAGITTFGNTGVDSCLIKTKPDSNLLPPTPTPSRSPTLPPSPSLIATENPNPHQHLQFQSFQLS
jgi:hypothetical protein